MSSADSAAAMRTRSWPCSAPAIPPSAPFSIWRSSRKTSRRPQIVWVLRGDTPEKSFGGGANDKLAARGELGKVFAQLVQGGGVRVETGFRLTHITASGRQAATWVPGRRAAAVMSRPMN